MYFELHVLRYLPRFIFIVDTDNSRVGNFERELCAFVTGMLDGCPNSSAQEEATRFTLEYPGGNPLAGLVMDDVYQEGGYQGPCSIWPTPGLFNDGLGNHYPGEPSPDEERRFPAYQSVAIFLRKRPDIDMLELLKNRSRAFSDRIGVKVDGFRLLEVKMSFETVACPV